MTILRGPPWKCSQWPSPNLPAFVPGHFSSRVPRSQVLLSRFRSVGVHPRLDSQVPQFPVLTLWFAWVCKTVGLVLGHRWSESCWPGAAATEEGVASRVSQCDPPPGKGPHQNPQRVRAWAFHRWLAPGTGCSVGLSVIQDPRLLPRVELHEAAGHQAEFFSHCGLVVGSRQFSSRP